MKNVWFFLIFSNLLFSQAEDPTFDVEKSVFRDTIECTIGSNLRLDDIFVNISTVEYINVSLFNLSKQFIKEIEHTFSLSPRSPRILLVKFDYTQEMDSSHYLVVQVKVRDYFSKILYPGYDYWLIKPKYPILTPLIDSSYSCDRKEAKFSFAALGLDKDTLYSYEIRDFQSGKVIKEENGKPIVILDDLLNDEQYFNRDIEIRGLYRGSTFSYKTSSHSEQIEPSVWITKISGPKAQNLICDVMPCEENGVIKICLNFSYIVDKLKYTSSIDCGSVSILVNSINKDLDWGIDFSCFEGVIVIEPSTLKLSLQEDLIVEFTDVRYNNEITRVLTINPDMVKK